MGEVGVKHGPEPVPAKVLRHAGLWVGIAAAFATAALVLLLWPHGLRYWLEPRFQVIEIHAAEKTMSLRRANHRYLVRCDDFCSAFHTGESYRLTIVGDQIRWKSSKQNIALPILEEEVDFTIPGGHG